MSIWSAAIAAFISHLAAGGRSVGTRQLRRYHLSRFAEVVDPLGPLDVDVVDLEAWLGRDDWTANTRRSARSSLVTFFSWIAANGWRADNPAALLATVTGVLGRPRPCPEQHLRAAVVAAGPRERLMLALGAGCGLRRAEISKVCGEHVEDTMDGPILRVVGKGGKVREVPISDDLAVRLRERAGYAFPSPRGGHLTPAHVGKLVSRLLPPGWTTHTLRHRFASAAYRADRDIRAVQELLGHASVATTQIYTAIPDDATRRASLAASIVA
ncbi:putative integrase [Gordonia phage GMA5]|uniref:Integrase n=1 Tax=Gordonia phage GMA5 TaxID=1647472 RepID=A0A0K0MWE8_9CAUD|nr:integrase [Gordonia phage GMA5]AKI28631.1 putative integrase [Gordonia phage GMA5]